MFYAVYVGKYPTASIPKKDVKKLADIDLHAYVFAVDGEYSLRVGAKPTKEKAEDLCKALRSRGFDAFIKEHN